MSEGKTSFLRSGVIAAAVRDRRAAAQLAAPEPTVVQPTQAAPAAPAAAPAAPPAATGLGPRLKRLIKDVFRPLVLPAMRRITWSVDRSETSARTMHFGAQLEALAVRLEHHAAQSSALRDTVETLSRTMREADAGRAGLQADAGVAGYAERLAAVEAGIADLARTMREAEAGRAGLQGDAGVAGYAERLAAIEEGSAELSRAIAEAAASGAAVAQMADEVRQAARRSLGLVVPLGNGLILVRTAIGFIALDTVDTATVAYLAEGYPPEQGSLELLARLLRLGDGFIDAGANYGIFSIVGGRAVSPGGRVLAVEPNPAVVRALRTSLHLNGLADRVRVEEVAGGREEATATFFVAEISGHSSLYPLDETAEPIEVRVRRLDDLTEPGSRWSVVKLDTEGAELDILLGMDRIRADNPDLHVIVEFGPSHIRRSNSSVEAWMAAWHEAGFVAYEIDPHRAVVSPLRETGLETADSLNLLMAPRGSEVIGTLLRPAA